MLEPGTRLGPYIVETLIGQGGMGEVYRATDTALERRVALKLLPPALATDPDRLMRFEREAKTLATLNHPHIAQIHGIAAAGTGRALVMEFVEGEDLAQRIARGPIPLEDALPIARQIAEALEAAHEAGIVHRDLKPANVRVKPDGTVKVLDFGLAKATEPGTGLARRSLGEGAESGAGGPLADSPTVMSPAMTQAGTVLGTAAYMAPEQARGKAVDRRVDIWAFGCVLFEMLCGVAAFQGDNITDVLAAVVRNEPGWRRLPAHLPPAIRQLLRRCLQTEPRARLRDIGDARLELESVAHEPTGATTTDVPEAGGRVSRRWAAAAAVLGLIAVALAALLVAAGRDTDPVSRAPISLAVTFPIDAQMHVALPRPSLAISPDGRRILYTAAHAEEGPHLWVRDLDRFEARPLAGTRDARMAVFSPDGRWVAFFADGKLKKIPLTAGPPLDLADAPAGSGAAWTSNDEIVFSLGTGGGLWRVAGVGGEPRRVASGTLYYPDALPGGKVVVTMPRPGAATSGDLTIAAVDVASGEVTRLFDGGTYARYSPTGHLVYLRNGELLATAFDPRSLAVGDERITVATGAYSDPSMAAANFALGPSGTLAYVPGDGSHFRRGLMVASPDGFRPLIDERRFYEWARLSPDGRRVAVMLRSWVDDIHVLDLARGTSTRITTGSVPALSAPLWSPDGRRVIVTVLRDGANQLLSLSSDGSGTEEVLRTSDDGQRPLTFTPDGRLLVFRERRPETGNDLLVLDMTDHGVRPLLATEFQEFAAAISPDGRSIAFQSNRSGQMQVHLASFPAMSGVVQVSTGGGTNPVWSRDGRRLYYNRGTFAANIEVVDVGPGSPPILSRPQAVGQFSVADGSFDVMPDGGILFVTGTGNAGSTPELRVIVNWSELVEREGQPRGDQ